MSQSISYTGELLNRINAIENLKLVDHLKVQGTLPAGQKVEVSVERFKFDSGVHNVPVNFSVIIRVDDVMASRNDMCFERDQKEFQLGWVRLINRLEVEDFKRDDAKLEEARAAWAQLG